MDKEKLRNVIYIIVAILLSIVAIQFVLWLLPIILIVFLACFLYSSMKRRHAYREYDANRKNYEKKRESKKKKIVIIDQESDQDK